MKINGNDIVIPVPISISGQKQLMLSYFKHMHPEGFCEGTDDGFMYHTDIEAKESWDKQGRTDENASKMFHVTCREGELTITHENTKFDVEEIRKNLKANFCF